jgi:hypothetical protein
MDSDLSAAYALRRMGHYGPSGKQVIVVHHEIATLLGTPRLLWMSDKPFRTVEGRGGAPLLPLSLAPRTLARP